MEGGKVRCSVCGGVDYVMEDGHYYCSECQTQSQAMFEEVFDDEVIGVSQSFSQPTPNTKEKEQDGNYTSWELMNYVLRAQVDELLSLGASPAYKHTVLQIWTYFLKKIEVAFFAKHKAKLPKLSVGYRSKDASLVYGVSEEEKKTKKAKIDSSLVNNLVTKYNICQSKKALMRKTAENSTSLCETAFLSTPDFLNVTNESAMSCTPEETEDMIVKRLRFAKVAQETCKKVQSKFMLEGKSIREISQEYRCSHITRLTVQKLFYILYLGMLCNGEKIYMSDLLRWARENHFSYFEVLHLLPKDYKMKGIDYKLFLQINIRISYGSELSKASKLAEFLYIRDWPSPCIADLAEKYITELNLPKKFCDLIKRFVLIVPLSFVWRPNMYIPNYEGRVLAILIIILKLLFGLDGKTEYCISSASSCLNKLSSNNSHTEKLFVWCEWVKYVICRKAVIIKHHFPTQESVKPDVYVNPFNMVNCWESWSKVNYSLFQSTKETCRLIKGEEEFFRNVVDQIDCTEHETLVFPASRTPYSSYISHILRSNNSSIDESAAKILLQDFSSNNIDYLLDPTILEHTAKDTQNKCVVVKKKRAQQKTVKVKKLKHNVVTVQRHRFKNTLLGVIVNGGQNSEVKAKGKARKRTASGELKDTDSDIICIYPDKEDNGNLSSEKKKKKKIRTGKKTKNKESKRRSKHNSDNKNNIIKMYIPCSQYWINDGQIQHIMDSTFQEEMLVKFPPSFAWLLKECACLAEMSPKTLYEEILTIEKLSFSSQQ